MTSSSAASMLGFEPFAEDNDIELRPHHTPDDVQTVIFAAYRQIFGNDYILQSERLTSAESLLRQGDISVKDFVRALAQSELYKRKFFSSTPQVRFIELNYKHILGRAPYDESEISFHVNLFVNQGYEAEINSYFDSLEYQSSFGESIVPSFRDFATHIGQKTVGFTRIFQLYRGRANSDRAQGRNKSAWLTGELATNSATPIQNGSFGKGLAGPARGKRGQIFRVRFIQASLGGSPQIRRSVQEYLVSFEQLSPTLQRLHQRGGRVVNITEA